MIHLLSVLVLLIFVAFVDAADPVFRMGTPTFLGSGCPDGSLAMIPADDGQSISILFSEYRASTSSKTYRDRKSCNLAVPVNVLPGISIGVFRVDYRGNAYVPDTPDAFANFQATYFFAGMTGPTYRKNFGPGFDEDIFISNQLGISAITWSPCGVSTNFRINTAITASKPKLDGEDTQIAIDTSDINVESGFRFFVTYRTC